MSWTKGEFQPTPISQWFRLAREHNCEFSFHRFYCLMPILFLGEEFTKPYAIRYESTPGPNNEIRLVEVSMRTKQETAK
jgi:hypothetical protein